MTRGQIHSVPEWINRIDWFWSELSDYEKRIPLIADVHTAYYMGAHNVLEEGVGWANEIYVAVEEGGSYRLMRGAVFTYYEFRQPASNRLTDEKWQDILISGKNIPLSPEWTSIFSSAFPAARPADSYREKWARYPRLEADILLRPYSIMIFQQGLVSALCLLLLATNVLALDFVAAGDVLLDRGIRRAIESNDPYWPLRHVAGLIQKNDLAMFNLESSLSSEWRPGTAKYRFRGNPEFLEGIRKSGFNVAVVANNHTCDFGPEGFEETLSALDGASIKYAGTLGKPLFIEKRA